MKGRIVQRYLSILFLIRRACLGGRSYVTCMFHPSFIALLDILVKHGFIRSYDCRDGGRMIVIWIKGSHRPDGTFLGAVSEISSVPHYQRNPQSVSCRFLKRLSRHDGSALYILNTDQGLVTHLDAIRMNIGGNILFRIV